MSHYIHTLFYVLPQLSSSLTKNAPQAILLYVKFVYFSFTRKFLCKEKPLCFTFHYNKQKFNLMLRNNTDIAVLNEVFVLLEYSWPRLNKMEVKQILDLGAHWGDSSLYFSLCYPNAVIHALEPSEGSYKRLVELSESFTNIKPIKAAFSDMAGKVSLFETGSSLGNSTVAKRLDTDTSIVVDAYPMENICKIAGVGQFDLIKFDIEGAEKHIFSDSNNRNLARAFIGEIHLDLMDVSLQQIESYFTDFDINITEINHNRYILKAVKRDG